MVEGANSSPIGSESGSCDSEGGMEGGTKVFASGFGGRERGNRGKTRLMCINLEVSVEKFTRLAAIHLFTALNTILFNRLSSVGRVGWDSG